ncbi:unnamed protein product [Parnassius mnemosyne]|uniref:Uncharacterized protein n=1 Tax=Parnassius mnemosyne TaxID=213953 RepID=A0AAV1LUE8_9NEOP
MGETPSGPLELLTSREKSALQTERCVNRTSGIRHSCPGMVGGVFPPPSRAELDAKREPNRSAFSFAVWASRSLCAEMADRSSLKQPWRETRMHGFLNEFELVSRRF